MQSLVLILLCILCNTRDDCYCKIDAHVTWYAPEMGDAMNCMEPCDQTAFSTPVLYGETAACGQSWSWNTEVFVPELGITRYCQDHGGAIDDDELDIAVPLSECHIVPNPYDDGNPFCWHPYAQPSTIRVAFWHAPQGIPEVMVEERKTNGQDLFEIARLYGAVGGVAASGGEYVIPEWLLHGPPRLNDEPHGVQRGNAYLRPDRRID